MADGYMPLIMGTAGLRRLMSRTGPHTVMDIGDIPIVGDGPGSLMIPGDGCPIITGVGIAIILSVGSGFLGALGASHSGPPDW